MRALAILTASVLASHSALAVSLPFTESFDYSEGVLTTVSGGTWFSSSTGPEISVSNSAALTAPAGFPAASGKGVKWAPSGTARRAIVQFTAVSSGRLYASFLLNVQSISAERLIAYFDDSSGSTTAPEMGVFINSTSIGIGKDASSPSFTTALGSGTHLVVVRYTFQAGNDQIDLWVDPSSADYGATNAPTSTGSLTAGGDPSSIPYFAINASGSGPVAYIDELRIGTNWADVVPGTPAPPPAATNFVVSQVFFTPDGSNIVLRGTGGSPTGMYEVVTATDLDVTVTNWPGIATNFFDLAGNFDSTNAVSPFDIQRFYCVHAGITNSTPAPPPGVPVILNQPQDLKILTGQTGVMSVIATGSPPLFYQWYFNTSSSIPDATNATLTVTNAGIYSAVISNAAASITSSNATLTVSAQTNYDMIGYATLGGGTTGGGNAATTTVTSATELEAALNLSVPQVVLVQGAFSINNIDSKPNKTIIGVGANATLIGTLKITHTDNIIIRNLTFHDADQDGVTIQQSTRVWVDHCTFFDAGDGELDVTHGSDWVTISWCKFYYTFNSGHNFVNLIGHNDSNAAEDTGHLRVTWHNNWWSTLCIERMPRVRFGQVHLFNNYLNPSVGSIVTNNYCVRAALGSQLFIENNFFEKVHNPWHVFLTPAGGTEGKVLAANNNIGFLDTSYGVTWGTTSTNDDDEITMIVPGTNTVFTPPYSYPLDPNANVPSINMDNVGPGKGPFAP